MISWKMKLTGYILIACAVACGFVSIFAPVPDRELTFRVAQFFAVTGVSMLFGNAGKTIVGEFAKAKEEAMK